MAYCGCCNKKLNVEFLELIQRTGWCSRCGQMCPVNVSKVPVWVIGCVLIIAIRFLFFT